MPLIPLLVSAGLVGAKRPAREPTAYNLYIREEMKRLKAQQPGMDHQTAFKLASNSE